MMDAAASFKTEINRKSPWPKSYFKTFKQESKNQEN
jgi:hypothetical protein